MSNASRCVALHALALKQTAQSALGPAAVERFMDPLQVLDKMASKRCIVHSLVAALLLAGALSLTSCQKASAPSRLALPFGSVDLPSPKAVVQGPLQVAGWALSEQPIEEVSVYVDRKYMGDTALRVARPDVAVAKPDYKNAATSGWMTTLETASLAPGWHEVVVQVRSQDGATRDLATIPVFVKR